LTACLFWFSNIKIEKTPRQDNRFSVFNSKREKGN
jgi:hypothetical protein